jgi:hypothetical protein
VARGGKAAGAAGGFLKKMLGDLIRPVKKRLGKSADDVAGKAADDVAAAGKKAAGGKRLPLSKADAIDAARRERDKLHDELAGMTKAERKDWLRNRDDVPRRPSKSGPGVVTSATDPETGITKAGVNHASSKPHPYGGCAEDDALDRINAERAGMDPPRGPLDRNQVYYSEARDLNQPGEMPICNRNCQEVSDPKQYPDGVNHMQPGRWDDPNRTDLPGGIG